MQGQLPTPHWDADLTSYDRMSTTTYPERGLAIARKGRYGLKLSTVLYILWIAGSAGGIIKLISQFIVEPLSSQLNYDRSTYLRTATRLCLRLNLSLSRIASHVPSTRSIKNGYMDMRTQTTDTRFGEPKSKAAISESQDWNEFKNLLLEKENMHSAGVEKGLTKKANALLDSVRKQNITASKSYSNYSSSSDDDPKSRFREVRKELRELKGRLLAA